MSETSTTRPAVIAGLDSVDAYDYHLPPELIAQHPAQARDQSRLMHVRRGENTLAHHHFTDLPDLLRAGDLLVVNDTRVIPARLVGKKPSGGEVEVFLSRPLKNGDWEAMIRMGSGKARPGLTVELPGGTVTLIEALPEMLWQVRLVSDGPLDDWLEAVGGIPLPPYIQRENVGDNRADDRERYQTVYARNKGAVAAPTAGLHFTPELFERLEAKGVARTQVTLHVGLGTFRPIREKKIEDVQLHAERYVIGQAALDAIAKTKARGGRVVAVGTTSVRTLESVARSGRMEPHEAETRLFLYPGCRLKLVDAMITNFHLPRSSLLMLVAAFAGKELMDRAYAEAVEKAYRFYSFGDAMLIE